MNTQFDNTDLDNLIGRLDRAERGLKIATRRVRLSGAGALAALALTGLLNASPLALAQTGDKALALLMDRVAALEKKTAPITIQTDPTRKDKKAGTELFLTGVNLHVVSGSTGDGATDRDGTSDPYSDPDAYGYMTGLGNVIIGYNETDQFSGDHSGSHNLVLGRFNDYSSYGGLVAGQHNQIYSPLATVSGGEWNQSLGWATAVSGGAHNAACDRFASVSGGSGNNAYGEGASISGGTGNMTYGAAASVSGGSENNAGDVGGKGAGAWVAGGSGNRATGDNSSVSGGRYNVASGGFAAVIGGNGNAASGPYSLVGGGSGNAASNLSAAVTGGNGNSASGPYSSVSGGAGRTAVMPNGWAAGSGSVSSVLGNFSSP